MTHYNQNEKNSFLRTRTHQVELEEDQINIKYCILDQVEKKLKITI